MVKNSDLFLVEQCSQQTQHMDTVSNNFIFSSQQLQQKIQQELKQAHRDIDLLKTKISIIQEGVGEIKHLLVSTVHILRHTVSKPNVKQLGIKVDKWNSHTYVTRKGILRLIHRELSCEVHRNV